MMLVATFWMVFWRCSTDFSSQRRGVEALLHVGARVGVGLVLVEQPLVGRADAQLRQAVVVEHRHVLIVDLHDVDVGHHVLGLARVVAGARLRVEVPDDLDVLAQIVDAHAHLARELGNLVVLQQAQVLGDDALGGRALEPEGAQLQRQALLQVAGGHAGRVEALHQAQHLLDACRSAMGPSGRSRSPRPPASRCRRGCR